LQAEGMAEGRAVLSFDYERDRRPAAPQRLYNISDGDTPTIFQPVRMVSVDTPEKAHYAGRPEVAQPKLAACRERLTSGFYPDIPVGFRDYLLERLDGDAAERHITAGEGASLEFQQLLTRRLTRPDGQQRRVATIPTGEIIDRYGRLLAYLAPWFAGGAADPLPPRGDPARRTFNYDMVAAGWAAPFLIYPSLPGNDDLNLFYEAAKAAWADARGAWAVSGRTLLLGYEYRLAIKLGTADTPGDGMTDAFQRICIDLRTNRSVGLHGWHDVPPPERLWVWTADQERARKDLAYTD
jgi:endonuclease YncB( thermonuclease family)